jgi:hypothetical protein
LLSLEARACRDARSKEAIAMRYRIFALVAALMGASALMLAQAQIAGQVTFILTNGDRVTGDIASTSEASPAMPNGELNLETRDGDERSFGQEMAAVIDYAGGVPATEELAALPDQGQMVAFRNGTNAQGRMVMLREDTLRWTNMSGRIEEIAVSAVSRIYLDPAAARRVFEYQPAAPAAAMPRAGRQVDGSIVVLATQPWTDTGMTVRRGDRLQFTVTGEIRVALGDGGLSSPDGTTSQPRIGLPVQSLPVGGLIGRVGSGQAFSIGSAPLPVTMPADGRLMLGINDSNFQDNDGYFTVLTGTAARTGPGRGR